jgi:amidohydrolase
MLPSLERSAGADRVETTLPVTGAEDFSYYAERVPGLFFWLGVRDPEVPAEEAAPNHSPRFRVDESALVVGVRALSALALDYLEANAN